MAKQFIATTLMDGYVDGPHITEVQTGIANQGLYGPDDYVLDEGKKAEAQILTNNSVRVFDATFVIQGRRDVMAANAYADVTIANGEQGMYRNDIIVRKYEKDEMTEIENTSFDVIKGTPSSGVATDPEIPTGDIRTGATMHNMALYRVKLEGLNIVALEPMFKVLYNMADIKKELESLNGKIEKQTLYSSAEKQIGVTDSGEPIYRKTIRAAMTYFSKPSSGYADCTISFGAYLKKILRADVHIVKNDNTEMYALPYSATGGSWGTWLKSITNIGTQQSVLHFNNNVAWGSAYTLVATIDYTK